MARDWQKVNKDEVERAVESPKFIHKSKCGCGVPIFTFTTPGEVIEGRLRTCPNHDRADRARCAHIAYFSLSGHEVTIAIRLSKMLWEAIDKPKADQPRLWGQWVRIKYEGSQFTKFGHAKKIYSVAYDKGSITPNYEGVKTNVSKQSKPRESKPIRLPKFARG